MTSPILTILLHSVPASLILAKLESGEYVIADDSGAEGLSATNILLSTMNLRRARAEFDSRVGG